METSRVSAIIRLKPDNMAWAKQQAKRAGKSFNAYIEQLIERERPALPKLPKDYKISEEIEALTCIKQWREPTREELEADPRLAKILGYER